MRPNQPYERRDADGGYGDRPPAAAARQGERQGRAIGDWMVRDERRAERDLEYEYEYADGGYGYARRTDARAAGIRTIGWNRPRPRPRTRGREPRRSETTDPGRRNRGEGTTNGDAPQSPGRKGFDADEDML